MERQVEKLKSAASEYLKAVAVDNIIKAHSLENMLRLWRLCERSDLSINNKPKDFCESFGSILIIQQ